MLQLSGRRRTLGPREAQVVPTGLGGGLQAASYTPAAFLPAQQPAKYFHGTHSQERRRLGQEES